LENFGQKTGGYLLNMAALPVVVYCFKLVATSKKFGGEIR
jgi:hypothetical protein